MPGSSTGTAPNTVLPSHSRSHEGPGAGSSGPPGRRHQRATGMTVLGTSGQLPTYASRPSPSSALPAGFIMDARRMLLEQRAFRIDQLNRLDIIAPGARFDGRADAARNEVVATLRETAHLVLTLVDAALHRIEQGSFGHCQRCGHLMSLERLAALPTSTWCGSCQHAEELGCVEPEWASEDLPGSPSDL